MMRTTESLFNKILWSTASNVELKSKSTKMESLFESLLMSVMDDWDVRAVIQKSYVLLTLFAELLYTVIIKMCTQTKTIEENRSNWTKNIIISLFHQQKVLAIKKVDPGCVGSTFFPQSLGEGQEKIYFGWGRSHSLLFQSAQKSSSDPSLEIMYGP